MQSESYRAIRSLFLVITLTTELSAQQGDQAGEVQERLPQTVSVPPAPILSPREGLRSITVERGFRVELVASEPLLEDPVAIAFDADGSLLVVEMLGFMNDIDGSREHAPIGRIVRLVDVDGDGAMDRSIVLLDHLILPRAVAPSFDGFLAIEPPELNFYSDPDGDGRIDRMLHLYAGFSGLESPEHAGNGLLYGIDNWIHVSQHPLRFRFDGERVTTQPTPGHGQWGITRDDVGRLFYTTNSDPLRADLVPLHYAGRNRNLDRLVGVNVRILDDLRIWPSRMTPGVNRGYRPETLDDHYRLTHYTAACGPTLYRGDAFPPEFRGNAFICEPSGFLVKRCLVTDDGEDLVGRLAVEGSEFLTSNDERFRPVNLASGPDGALYVVDMYRGILQHRVFMTSFLRQQIVDRELDRPTGLGRIYRVVPEHFVQPPLPALSSASDESLVETLRHANGWWRDTAQRLLVERRAEGTAPALRILAADTTATIPSRLHALWTLAGIEQLRPDDLIPHLDASEPTLEIHALRMSEPWLDAPAILPRVVKAAASTSARVRVQAALTLGAGTSDATFHARRAILAHHSSERAIRSAILSGLQGRELEFLTTLLEDRRFNDPADGRDTAFSGVIGCILKGGDFDDLTELLEIATRPLPEWQTTLLFESLAKSLRIDTPAPRRLVVTREPKGLEQFASSTATAAPLAARLMAQLRWPGRVVEVEEYVWSDVEKELRQRGELLYNSACANCHRVDGEGIGGVAPPLVGTPWVVGPPARLARILLHGLAGPIEVDEIEFNADMPRSVAGRDDQIAAILTYVRDSWGNNAPPISLEQVAEIRDQTRGRRLPWTAPELLRID